MRSTRTRRRAVLRTSAVITIAALGLTAAPAAFADTATETVDHVVTRDDGTLDVALSGTDQPLWLQITVRSSTAPDAAPLLTTDDTVERPGGGHTSAPVKLPARTAYGDYPVDVDFRLPGGTVQHWSGAEHGAAGLLNYRRHAFVTGLTFDRVSTDYDHRTATLSGAVELLDPATGEQAPAPAGAHVRVRWSVERGDQTLGQSAPADTDATGAFQLPITPDGTIRGVMAQVENPAPSITPASWGTAPNVIATPTTYRISATPSRTRRHAGEKFTMYGSVQRLTGGVWQPFAAVPVVTASTEPRYYTVTGVIGSGTTAADGTFSYAATAYRTMTHYTFLRPSPYLRFTDDANTLYVPTAGSITLPAFTIDQYATVKTTGRLNGNCSYQPLYLQFSPNGSTGWVNLKRVTASYTYTTYCSYYIAADGAYDGYYRVYHPESNEMLTVATSAHRLKRTRTAMSITMTPSNPYPNAKLTATGVVTQLTSAGWVHYAGAHVVLVYKPRFDSQWYWVVKGYTNAQGRFTLNTQAYGDGTWAAYLDADSTHFYSETRQVYVDVR